MLDKEKAINEIIEEFDFEKVKSVMEYLKWTWDSVNNETGIPSTGKLVKRAESLLNEAWDKSLEYKEDYMVSTGGFKAQAYYDNELFRIDLTFELSSWSVYEEV